MENIEKRLEAYIDAKCKIVDNEPNPTKEDFISEYEKVYNNKNLDTIITKNLESLKTYNEIKPKKLVLVEGHGAHPGDTFTIPSNVIVCFLTAIDEYGVSPVFTHSTLVRLFDNDKLKNHIFNNKIKLKTETRNIKVEASEFTPFSDKFLFSSFYYPSQICPDFKIELTQNEGLGNIFIDFIESETQETQETQDTTWKNSIKIEKEIDGSKNFSLKKLCKEYEKDNGKAHFILLTGCRKIYANNSEEIFKIKNLDIMNQEINIEIAKPFGDLKVDNENCKMYPFSMAEEYRLNTEFFNANMVKLDEFRIDKPLLPGCLYDSLYDNYIRGYIRGSEHFQDLYNRIATSNKGLIQSRILSPFNYVSYKLLKQDGGRDIIDMIKLNGVQDPELHKFVFSNILAIIFDQPLLDALTLLKMMANGQNFKNEKFDFKLLATHLFIYTLERIKNMKNRDLHSRSSILDFYIKKFYYEEIIYFQNKPNEQNLNNIFKSIFTGVNLELLREGNINKSDIEVPHKICIINLSNETQPLSFEIKEFLGGSNIMGLEILVEYNYNIIIYNRGLFDKIPYKNIKEFTIKDIYDYKLLNKILENIKVSVNLNSLNIYFNKIYSKVAEKNNTLINTENFNDTLNVLCTQLGEKLKTLTLHLDVAPYLNYNILKFLNILDLKFTTDRHRLSEANFINIENPRLTILKLNISEFTDEVLNPNSLCIVSLDCPNLRFINLHSDLKNVEYYIKPKPNEEEDSQNTENITYKICVNRCILRMAHDGNYVSNTMIFKNLKILEFTKSVTPIDLFVLKNSITNLESLRIESSSITYPPEKKNSVYLFLTEILKLEFNEILNETIDLGLYLMNFFLRLLRNKGKIESFKKVGNRNLKEAEIINSSIIFITPCDLTYQGVPICEHLFLNMLALGLMDLDMLNIINFELSLIDSQDEDDIFLWNKTLYKNCYTEKISKNSKWNENFKKLYIPDHIINPGDSEKINDEDLDTLIGENHICHNIIDQFFSKFMISKFTLLL